jgi:hypothetical protein
LRFFCRLGGRRATVGVEGHAEPDIDPLPHGGVGELDQAVDERGVHFGRLGERHGRDRQGVLAEHRLEPGYEGDLRVADAQFRQSESIPRIRPVRLELGGPLEFRRGVIVMVVVADVTHPDGEKSES